MMLVLRLAAFAAFSVGVLLVSIVVIMTLPLLFAGLGAKHLAQWAAVCAPQTIAGTILIFAGLGLRKFTTADTRPSHSETF